MFFNFRIVESSVILSISSFFSIFSKKIQFSISFFHDGCGEIGGVRRVDELSFNTGDLFTISRKTEFDAEGNELDSEWWWAKRASNDNGGVDEEGYVPRNFVGMWPRIQSR